MLYRELNTVGGYLSPACGGGKITSTQFFLIDKGILQWCAKGIVIKYIFNLKSSYAKVTAPYSSYTYSGSAIKPALNVKFKDGDVIPPTSIP